MNADPYVSSHGSPSWLPITFNLTYELPQFAVYFQVIVHSLEIHRSIRLLFSIEKINIWIIVGSLNQLV